VELEFTLDAMKAVAAKAIERNTGARGLRSILEETMTDIMFRLPSQKNVAKVVITADCVNGTGEPVIEKK
ncbi:MAG: ATP-dependent Clp protease ATP-binding subunit ClpX, partial [Clostridia bacterium]|nr:ATP-dependent Clp protease ATP-binding subunit ClpX [Clostridia bacterium]